MAEKRMFAQRIIDSDAFLDMPSSTQALYFHLAMRADDDGFIDNPKKIQRICGASTDDMKLLAAKSFLIPFESGVVVIKHWRVHNYIAKDRYSPTIYQDEKATLELNENKEYTARIQPVYIPSTDCIQNDDSDKIRLDKIREDIDKSKEKKSKKEKKSDRFADRITTYTTDEDLRKALTDFVEHRKVIKKPLSDLAFDRCLATLDRIGKTDWEKVQIVNKTIERGWAGFFPLKDDDKSTVEKTKEQLDYERNAPFLAPFEW